MSKPPATRMTAAEYEEAARRYCESLPPEHFMESTMQSGQRAIGVDGFEYLRGGGVEVHILSELLVQYFFEGNLRQVVPDNMLVRGNLSRHHRGSWDVELEPLSIFMTMEYVSAKNRRKDYVDSYAKYEAELKVPYYLTIEHERHDLRLHRLEGERYVRVPAGANGRWAVPELELEIGWQGEWVRFWYRGELLPVSEEHARQLRQLSEQLRQKDESLQHKDLVIQQKDEVIEKRDEVIQQKDMALQARDDQLRQREDTLRERDELVDSAVRSLLPLVEARARSLSRQDILDQLTTTTDLRQLTRWLAEMK